ncbi:hypothetical protein FT663_04901 [Candidozyma haemuli var. vulneris]|uniref:RRM domain-containing protein n=1 Tax=Candidozyma haemuli TaxID=45357 RepID=A0A2V1ATU7_9ASCO|nr:hypothetical protein CXQ85_004217 [[Candida] haemuloni]KAF3986384.1 hypothetical protein FT663_04901 [[Candida] haemuloni var. vulneris]KAF3991525.1 hypothetical protein FT662_01644 [[Candida] haemuloni var. vulneris]PVH20713.1 hypothetical protein CXQ85_004217 [[Candida] haemuloni]
MSKPVIEERVYVGNLDYSITEEDIKEFFTGLQIESVDIPTKTFTKGTKEVTKRLGFGFVQFASKEDADEAIERSNGKVIKVRTLFSRKAVPPASPEEKKEKRAAFLAKKAAIREQKQQKEQEKANAEKTDAADSVPKEKKAGVAANGDAEKKQDKTKTPEGTPSNDTVFITNLDFKANVKVLDAIFKELEPKWIHVPAKKVPRHILRQIRANHRPIYNRGIAFVKFADQETQQRAISEFNGRDVNGRSIIVEAAVDRPRPEGDEEVQGEAQPVDAVDAAVQAEAQAATGA